MKMVSRILGSSVAKYGIASIFTRGIAILSTIILTPLIIGNLGNTGYAIWFLSTLIPTVIAFPDLGISNGVINRVTIIFRKEGNIDSLTGTLKDLQSILVFLGLFWLIIGTVAILAYCSLAFKNPEPIFLHSLWLALLIFCLGVPPVLWSKVQLALERGHENVVWEGIGKVSALILSLAVVNFSLDVRYLVITTLFPPVFFLYVNAWIFTSKLPNNFLSNHDTIRNKIGKNIEIIKDGGYFTLIQLAFVLGFALDNFLIGYFLSMDAVSYSSILRRPFDALPLVVTLFSTALWPVFNRLQASGQYRKSIFVLSGLFIWSGILISLLSYIIFYWREEIYGFLGNNNIDISKWDIFWVSFKTLIVTLTIIIQNYISAIGLIKQQAWIQISSAVASLAVVIYFLSRNDLGGYFFATAIAYTLLNFIPMLLTAILNVRRKVI